MRAEESGGLPLKPAEPPTKRGKRLLALAIASVIIAVVLVQTYLPADIVVKVNLWDGVIRVPPGGTVEKPAFVPPQTSWSVLEGNFTRLGQGNVISMRLLDQDGNILWRFGPANSSSYGFQFNYRPGKSLYIRFVNVIPIVSGTQPNYTSNNVRAFVNLTYSYQKNPFQISVQTVFILGLEMLLVVPVAAVLKSRS